jgi:hypothetical protein
MNCRVLISLSLCLLTAGCAHAPLAAVWPHPDCTSWREVASEHFRIRTDLSSEDAAKTVQSLEKYRSGVLALLGKGFDPPGKADVIVFSSVSGLEELAPEGVRGFVFKTVLHRGHRGGGGLWYGAV